MIFFVQEMERVWSQYERMESELSVFRSHLQHICNFGMPQVTRKKTTLILGLEQHLYCHKSLTDIFFRNSVRPRENCG